MSFRLPSDEELRDYARSMGWQVSDARVATIANYLAPFADGYGWLDSVEDELPALAYPKRSYRVPEPGENPHNAWFVLTEIETNSAGPLRGKRIAVKDNIFVAGVPLSDGTAMLKDFIADYDATAVSRLLEAGAKIVGKSNCEYLCMSGGSTTSSHGVVDNPRMAGYSTAGSSSGSAALVAAGEVDMALGTDQGGSVRAPASWTGICGMKATRGVVPYTGGMVMETAVDYIGPMTRSVADNAAMLNVIAEPHASDYGALLGAPIDGMRIGILDEGFGHPLSDPIVDTAVREAAGVFAEAGARITNVSVPLHTRGLSMWGAIVSDGAWQSLRLRGLSYNYEGVYSPGLHAAMKDWEAHLAEMPINAQVLVLLGRHLERYQGRYYARAKNLVNKLRAAYDATLNDVDVLLMPTTVQRASPNPQAGDLEGIFAHAFNNTINTAQFNATGHPAISIPCANPDGLPVGLMLVGRYHDEARLYQLAHTFEQRVDWQKR